MRGNRTDANQTEIVAALRKLGYSVAITSSLGNGFPDIVVGKHGKNWLFEIKDAAKFPSEQRLTDKEQEFFDNWRGQVSKVNSLDQILEVING